MPAKATSRRLSRLEAKTARGKLLVCRCATHNGRRNLPPGEHLPGCPVLAARDGDNVIRVVFGAVADVPDRDM